MGTPRLMNDNALERSNLFQLNVLIWATFPQPPGAPVKPVLRNLGYCLFSLEQPLIPSIEEQAILQAREPTVTMAPVADVLLEDTRRSHLVVVECKASSFGVESDKARQARGFIYAGSHIARRSLPTTPSSAEVCYIVPGTEADAMEGTLVSLREELQTGGTQVCGVGAVAVTIREDGIYLRADHRTRGGGSLPQAVAPEQRVLETKDGGDPRPLYVIPWIPGSQDEDLSALREKLRSQLLSHIGRPSLGEVKLRFDDLLDEVSLGVYGLWRDRASLQGQVNATVGNIVRALTDGHEAVTVRTAELALTLDTEEKRRALMEQIRTADVPPYPPEGHQLPLENTSVDGNHC